MSPQLTDTKPLAPMQVRRSARYKNISDCFVLLIPLGAMLWLAHISSSAPFAEEVWMNVAQIFVYVGFFAIMPAGYFDAKIRLHQEKAKRSQ